MKLAVIMSGFPRRSETFALNELVALEAAGLLEAVFATKAGDGSAHPGLERVAHRVRTLAPGTPAQQAREVAAALADLPISGLHAYFAHVPAEVASHAAGLLGCPWGFSTHALDARKVPPAELAERARRAACIVACNHDVAAELSASGRTRHAHPTRRRHRAVPTGWSRDDQWASLGAGRWAARREEGLLGAHRRRCARRRAARGAASWATARSTITSSPRSPPRVSGIG